MLFKTKKRANCAFSRYGLLERMPAIERNALHTAAAPMESMEEQQQSALLARQPKEVASNEIDLLGLGDIFGPAPTSSNQQQQPKSNGILGWK
jgi:hypothetical protein